MIKCVFLSVLGTCFVLAALPAVATACAVCITGAGDDGVAEAFNWSVLFLMATPYVVVASIVGWIFFSLRRATAKRESVGNVEPPVRLVWNPKESER